VPDLLSSQLLGFPADARVLLVNADDLGMHPAINDAIVSSIEDGIARSCSVMAPCPGAEHAFALLRERPAIACGVHLTLVRDAPADRWAPIAPGPSLVDAHGLFPLHRDAATLLARARNVEVEREFRAQLDAVLRAGVAVTHLDFHCIADGGRDDILDVALGIAAEHGLAVRVWSDPARDRLRGTGLPVIDHAFVDSFALDVAGKAEQLAARLRALPAGLTEWAMHPGLDRVADDPADHGWEVRRSDHAFLTSPAARALVEEEGIELIGYDALVPAWR
jgi:predicted glycoside hydrolase/deacetylase ChbG (UPF0249 family)